MGRRPSLVVLLLATTGGAAPLGASFPGSPAELRFYNGSPAQIYAVQPDTSGLRLLSDGSAAETDHNWSPDGTRLVFTRPFFANGTHEIFTMNADGTGLTRLTNNNVHDVYPSWTPDSARIVFVSDRSGNYEIYSMLPDGSDVQQVTSTVENEFEPVVSIDGTIAAIQDDAQVVLFSIEGSLIDVLYSDQSAHTPEWSPDGQRLAFAGSAPEGGLAIYVIERTGVGLERISAGPGHGPAWSPDSLRIVYVENSGNYGALISVGPHGETPSSLGLTGDLPEWRPSPIVGPPTTRSECLMGGWARFNFPRTFRNQGECIAFVSSGR
jgi:Tol biopolymer transport system component